MNISPTLCATQPSASHGELILSTLWKRESRSLLFDHHGLRFPRQLPCTSCFEQAVKRGAMTPLVVGDMPFGSYEVNPEQALRTAFRFVKVFPLPLCSSGMIGGGENVPLK